MTKQPEKHTFQAEVNQILSLVVNSLYTHKEIFLRELISNASDALDHLSFRALTEPDVLGEDPTLEIRVAADTDARTLTISDNGVGMGHDELVQNLGTIAHSGTKQLAERMKAGAGDVNLIGQFGVGFYSAFLVADRVEVISRLAGSDQAYRWESNADGSYTIEDAERAGRGTDVILHLKVDTDGTDENKQDPAEFMREWVLRDLVRKYSDYVRHPIRLRVEKSETVGEGDDAKTETSVEWEQANSASALWTRPKSEITDDAATEFYKHLTHDWEAPLAHTHFKVEGMQEMAGLLFVPRRAPMETLARRKTGVRLFVKRVFIMDDCEELLPDYLRFIRGVVDSDDLPLNVSREVLQKDRTTTAIRKQVVRHALRMLESLADRDDDADAAAKQEDVAGEDEADDSDDSDGTDAADTKTDTPSYDDFWSQFGIILKEGVHSDTANRDKIARLLRFQSSASSELTSLAAYVERMKEGQEGIYYVSAPNRAAAEASPHLEALRKKEYEVLYMTDPIDEWVVDGLRSFDERDFVSAAKGALDLPESDEEKEEREEKAGTLEGLIAGMKTALGEHVEDVRVTSRLTDSPACLVVGEGGIAPHVERLLRAQNMEMPAQKRILEINPAHPVVERLNTLAADESGGEELSEWAHLLYDQALIAEGSPPSDPVSFARRITRLLEAKLS